MDVNENSKSQDQFLPAAAISLAPCEDHNEDPQVVETDSTWTGERVSVFVQRVIAAERERCAKIAEGGMPDQNNPDAREMMRAMKPELSEAEIVRILNQANRTIQSCSAYISAKIRSGE